MIKAELVNYKNDLLPVKKCFLASKGRLPRSIRTLSSPVRRNLFCQTNQSRARHVCDHMVCSFWPKGVNLAVTWRQTGEMGRSVGGGGHNSQGPFSCVGTRREDKERKQKRHISLSRTAVQQLRASTLVLRVLCTMYCCTFASPNSQTRTPPFPDPTT